MIFGGRDVNEYKPKNLENMPFGCWVWVICMIMIAVWLVKKYF